jgi:ParB family chromosome partitioning protein
MFTSKPDDLLSADNKQTLPRVASGAVRSLKDTFTDVEKEYQSLRDRLERGDIAIEIDPQLVDPSPLADRFIEQDSESFESLKRSIEEQGQQIPILVRDHPTLAGRFQSAYGHRRVRAIRELGLAVKAYVRALSDEDLVLAQGIENSAREDLSFIERAAFALKLEQSGFERSIIQSALSIDRAEASKLIAVARSIPRDIIDAIGRAPKVGRGRWQSLADVLSDANSLQRARDVSSLEEFRTSATDERFMQILSSSSPSTDDSAQREAVQLAMTHDGAEIARLTKTTKQCRIQLNRAKDEQFAAFLMRRLPDIYEAYLQEGGGKKSNSNN